MLYCIVTGVPLKAPSHESKCQEHPTHFIGRREHDNRQPTHLKMEVAPLRLARALWCYTLRVGPFHGATQLTAERWQSG